MKAIRFFLFSLIILAGLSSCSDEETGPVASPKAVKNAITGKWKQVDDYWNEVQDYNMYYEFKSNYAFEYTYFMYKDEKYNNYESTFSIDDGWERIDGEINGYINIKHPDGSIEPHHCWIKGKKMTIVPKYAEQDGVMFFQSPYLEFIKQ